MSGGYFDYRQYHIEDIARRIESLIANNDSEELDEFGSRVGRGYQPEVIQKFREALPVLRAAGIYAQRIDYLVCNDDGQEQFLRRLEEELSELDRSKGSEAS